MHQVRLQIVRAVSIRASLSVATVAVPQSIQQPAVARWPRSAAWVLRELARAQTIILRRCRRQQERYNDRRGYT